MENLRQLGTQMETAAAKYLQAQGLTILTKNYRTRTGEIDLIGTEGSCLVFIEVKYRKTMRCGSGTAAVTAAKQKTICKVSDYYRYEQHIPVDTSIRYDVIALSGELKEDGSIDEENVSWIRNAFPYCGRCFA